MIRCGASRVRATVAAAAAAALAAVVVPAFAPAAASFTAPVAALAADGTGIVAWGRGRRAYAVSIANGRIGRAKEVAASNGIDDLAVAAGPGGEATIAWIARPRSVSRYEVRTVRRRAGRNFGTMRVIRSTRRFVSQLLLAADERGLTTAAWTEDEFGHAVGYNGITTSVRTSTATPGRAFATPRVVTAPRQIETKLVAIEGP
jgi:hypothetical protein